MAHTFDVDTSHERLRSYTVQVEAGLDALAPLQVKVVDWQAMKVRVVGHRTLWEDGSDALTKAQAKNRVADTDWDTSYTQGSGIAYLLSGKQKKNDPYATVMKVPARRATRFGHAKATEVGDKVLGAVPRFALPQLTEWALAFRAANDALRASGKTMNDAEDALDDPRFGKRGLVRGLNTLIAETEAFILTTYPGRNALADAILVPAWTRRPAKEQDEVIVGEDELVPDAGDVPDPDDDER